MAGSQAYGSDSGSEAIGPTTVRFQPRQRRKAQNVAAVVADPGQETVFELRRGDRRVELPLEMAAVLDVVAKAFGAGEDVTIVVRSATGQDQLSSQQAADLLNVSRPYIVKLANTGELPYYKVGNRHRFRYDDVMAYKQRESVRREEILGSLAPSHGYRREDF